MAAEKKLRPIKDEKELQAVPLNEPVLVELPEGVTGFDGEAEIIPLENKRQEKTAVEEGAESLSKQLEQLKAADAERQKEISRAQAEVAKEKQARIAAEQAATREKELRQTETKEFFGTAVEGAKAELDAAKIAFKQAYASGDADAIAEAQVRISDAASKINQLRAAEADFDATPQKPQQEPVNNQPIDLMAQVEANPNLLAEEKTWLKAHPEVILDVRKNQELGVAYERAVKKGIARGTPAYFQFLNEFMEYEKPARQQQTEEGDTNVAAPVSRESNNGSSPSDRRVTLSPEQRELAKNMGLTDIQYAEQVLRLRQDKQANPERYGRTS